MKRNKPSKTAEAVIPARGRPLVLSRKGQASRRWGMVRRKSDKQLLPLHPRDHGGSKRYWAFTGAKGRQYHFGRVWRWALDVHLGRWKGRNKANAPNILTKENKPN